MKLSLGELQQASFSSALPGIVVPVPCHVRIQLVESSATGPLLSLGYPLEDRNKPLEDHHWPLLIISLCFAWLMFASCIVVYCHVLLKLRRQHSSHVILIALLKICGGDLSGHCER